MSFFKFSLTIMTFVMVTPDLVLADWSIDLSRRTESMRIKELQAHPAEKAEQGEATKSNILERLFDPGEPQQDIVILSTERGFVPNVIRVRKDGRYRVHVVNVNEREKNISFILDGFSENHATYFGKVKTFQLEPRKEGTYSFLSQKLQWKGSLSSTLQSLEVRLLHRPSALRRKHQLIRAH